MEQLHNYIYKAKSAKDLNRKIGYLHRVSKLLAQHDIPSSALLDLHFCKFASYYLADSSNTATVKALVVNILRIGFDSATVVGPMPPDVHHNLITLRATLIAENVMDGILLFFLDLVQQLKENNDSLVLLEQQFADLKQRNQMASPAHTSFDLSLENSEQQEKPQESAHVQLSITQENHEELSDISILMTLGTQQDKQLGRTDLGNAVASDSVSQSSRAASPSPFEDIDNGNGLLGLQNIMDLQHKKYTADKHNLLKARTTLLDDIVSLLFLLENIFSVQLRPSAGGSGNKSVSKGGDTARAVFNNFRGQEDDVFRGLLTISLSRSLPQLLSILINLVTTDVMAGLAAPLLRLLTVLLHSQSLYSIKADTTQPAAFRNVNITTNTRDFSKEKSPRVKLHITGSELQASPPREGSSRRTCFSEALSFADIPPISSDLKVPVRLSRHAVVGSTQALLGTLSVVSPQALATGPTNHQNSPLVQSKQISDMMLESYYSLCRRNPPRKPLGDTFVRLKSVQKKSPDLNVNDLLSGLSNDSDLHSDIYSLSSDNETDPSGVRRSSLTSAKTILVYKIPVTWPYISQPPVFTQFHTNIMKILCLNDKLITFIVYCTNHISAICQVNSYMWQGFSKQLQYTKRFSVETDAQLTNSILCCVFAIAAQAASHLCFYAESLSDTEKIDLLGRDCILQYIKSVLHMLNSVFEGFQRNSTVSSGFNDYNNWYIRDIGISCFYWISELIHCLGTKPIAALGKRLMSLAEEKNNATLMRTLPQQMQEIAAEGLKKRLQSENERLYRAMPIFKEATLHVRLNISCLHTLSYMLETWVPYKGAELQCLCRYAQLLMTEDHLHDMLQALSLTGEKTFSVSSGFATKSVTGQILTLDESTRAFDEGESEIHLNLDPAGDNPNVEMETCTYGMFVARQISGSAFVTPLLVFADSMFERLTFGKGQEEVCTVICKMLDIFTGPDMEANGQMSKLFSSLECILVLLSFLDKPAITPSYSQLQTSIKRILDVVCDPAYMTSELVVHLFKPMKVPVYKTPFFKAECQKLDNLLITQYQTGAAYNIKARHAGVRYQKDTNTLVINKDLVTEAALDEILGDISGVDPSAPLDIPKTGQQLQESDKDDLSFGSELEPKERNELKNDTSIEEESNNITDCTSGFTPEINRIIIEFVEKELKNGITLEDAMGALMIKLDCNFTVAQLTEQWKILSIKSGKFSTEEDDLIRTYARKYGGLTDALINELTTILRRKPGVVRRRILTLQANRAEKRHVKP